MLQNVVAVGRHQGDVLVAGVGAAPPEAEEDAWERKGEGIEGWAEGGGEGGRGAGGGTLLASRDVSERKGWMARSSSPDASLDPEGGP